MDGSNAPKVLDCYGTGHVPPTLDDKQDVNLLEYDVSSSTKYVKFKRKLNTGDEHDAVLVQGQD